MDGLSGLESVFEEEFPKAKIQRCQVHVARNVLAKVPKKFKQAVADDMRTIFYASTKEKALESFEPSRGNGERISLLRSDCLEEIH